MMKKILFPTDFSSIAANALPFAVAVAKRTKAELILVHAYHPNHKECGRTLQTAATAKMQKLIRQIQPNLGKKASVRFIVRRARTLPFLKLFAKCADLVILGTKRSKDWTNLFAKHLSSTLIQRTTTPILVVPETCTFKAFKNIVLSVDESPVNGQKVIEPLREIAANFQASLTLFHTEESPMDKGIHEQVLACLDDGVGYSIDYNFVQQSVPKSIEDMAVDYDVDLVGLIRRKRNFMSALFHESITQKEVLESQVPLLILQDA